MGGQKFEHIETIDADCRDLNEAIKTVNWACDSWKDLVDPIDKYEKESKKHAKMEKCGGANAKHILLGATISVCTDADVTSADIIKKEFQILDKKPWVVLGPKLKKWDGLSDSLPKWIEAYLDAPDQMKEISDKLGWLENEIPGAIEKAPEAFAELETMKKAKCVAQCAKTGKDLKKLFAQLKESAEKLKKDAVELKEGLTTLQKELDDGKFMEHGKVCREAKLNEIQECYEKIYGPVPAGKKANDDGGCCTIF